MTTTVAFRVTCGGDCGWGHWMRTLTLLDALRTKRPRCRSAVIFNGPVQAVDLARERLGALDEISFHPLMDGDEDFFHADPSFDVAVLDRLERRQPHLDLWRLRAGKLAVFDDMGCIAEGADVVIRPQLLPSGSGAVRWGRLLYGPQYFPIAAAWLGLRESYDLDRADRLVVCLGGGTTNRLGYLVAAEALRLSEGIDKRAITFVLGYELGRSNLPKILREVLGDVEVLGAANLPVLLKSARLALIAGGFIKYDVACAGIPNVIVSGPDHQTVLAHAFADAGAGVYAGRINQLPPHRLSQTLQALWHDSDTLKDLSRAGKQLVDGLGTDRILEHLL